jgi:dTDP-4-dehydrorhamnose reductase
VRILLTGATGQIGSELLPLLHRDAVLAPAHRELDLGDSDAIRSTVRAFQPELIINPAAYTAVDGAETDEQQAHHINAIAPGVLGEEARRLGIPLIHYSTDYVFDGSASSAYSEDDPPAPLNAYGRTKLDGERAVRESGCIYLILRTSWVYSRHGRNFLLTIERLAAEKPKLAIVADQHGIPNWARDLARASARLACVDRDELSQKSGIYHLSSRGLTTWFEFAKAIVASMNLERAPDVVPIATSDYPTAARRPAFAALDAAKLEREFGIALPHWRDALRECQASSRH